MEVFYVLYINFHSFIPVSVKQFSSNICVRCLLISVCVGVYMYVCMEL